MSIAWKPIAGFIILIVAIYAIAMIFTPNFNIAEIISNLLRGNIFSLSPYGVYMVIASGSIIFVGYVLYQLKQYGPAKFCLNVAPILLFFGFILIELTVFSAYLSSTSAISVTQCQQGFVMNRVEDIPLFTTCLFTGYYPSQGISFASLSFATFVIFFWVLPFAFLYFFFYGLFESTMTPMFGGGGTGKTVSTVISFIVAMYGARQAIGAFLIDLLAYGSWGLVGIFIPLFLVLGIKKIMDHTIPVKFVDQTVWSAVGVDVWAECKRLENDIKELQQAALIMKEKGERLDSLKASIDERLRMAEALEKVAQDNQKPAIAGAKRALEFLKKEAG